MQKASSTWKVVVLGDPSTGKTTLCHRLEDPNKESGGGVASWKGNQEYFYFDGVVSDAASGRKRSPKADDGDDTDRRVQSTLSIQMVDQPGIDRFSLQPIIFRKAAGVVVLIDAPSLYKEYLVDCVSSDDSGSHGSSSRNVTSQFPATGTSTVESGSSASPTTTSSRFFLHQGSVKWDAYLKELIIMWKTIVNEESEFSRLPPPSYDGTGAAATAGPHRQERPSPLPCIVLFTKADELPQKDPRVDVFCAECKVACASNEVKADHAVFTNLRSGSPQEMVALQNVIATLVYKQIVMRPRAGSSDARGRRQGSVFLNEPSDDSETRSNDATQDGKKKKRCCA